jgi:hypothetical protein
MWLPPCFAVWYFSASYQAAFDGALARVLIDQFKSGLIATLEQSGFLLVFVTTIEVHPAPGQTGVLAPEVNPLLYTYGLALFFALMLACRAHWWKILAGAVALLPFQSWGIAFDFLAQVYVGLGAAGSEQAGLTGWRAEAIALSYQIGYLILPSVVPVVLWAFFNHEFITRIPYSEPPDCVAGGSPTQAARFSAN